MRAGPGSGPGPSLHTSHPLWFKSSNIEGLGFLSLYGGSSLLPAGRNPQKMRFGILLSLYGGLSLPLANRNPQKLKICCYLSLYGGPSLPLAGRNLQKMKILDFLSLHGRPSLPRGAGFRARSDRFRTIRNSSRDSPEGDLGVRARFDFKRRWLSHN